jgi:hypothetical protein
MTYDRNSKTDPVNHPPFLRTISHCHFSVTLVYKRLFVSAIVVLCPRQMRIAVASIPFEKDNRELRF